MSVNIYIGFKKYKKSQTKNLINPDKNQNIPYCKSVADSEDR